MKKPSWYNYSFHKHFYSRILTSPKYSHGDEETEWTKKYPIFLQFKLLYCRLNWHWLYLITYVVNCVSRPHVQEWLLFLDICYTTLPCFFVHLVSAQKHFLSRPLNFFFVTGVSLGLHLTAFFGHRGLQIVLPRLQRHFCLHEPGM